MVIVNLRPFRQLNPVHGFTVVVTVVVVVVVIVVVVEVVVEEVVESVISHNCPIK